MAEAIYKIGRFRDPARPSAAEEVRHNYLNSFEAEETKGVRRLRIGAAGDPVVAMQTLSSLLSEPLFLLLVLHTSRCDSMLARYQSPPVRREGLQEFFSQFGTFLGVDARHDTWIHSQKDNATIVLDRHNLIYAYGPIEAFRAALLEMGFREGVVEIPVPHIHNYHPEFDAAEKQILAWFDWSKTPLRPDDQQ